MADEAATRRKFEVIRAVKRAMPEPQDFLSSVHQSNLFPAPRRGMMIFMYFPDVTEEEFRATVEYAKPSCVIELRSAPRFDIGTLNRRLAFEFFQGHSSNYIDLACPGKGSGDLDYILWECRTVLKDRRLKSDRPLMFLMNTDDADHGLPNAIRGLVSSVLPEYKEIFEVPHFVA